MISLAFNFKSIISNELANKSRIALKSFLNLSESFPKKKLNIYINLFDNTNLKYYKTSANPSLLVSTGSKSQDY